MILVGLQYMETKLDNVLLLEKKKLLKLDHSSGILVSSTSSRKAQALIFFLLLGISISMMWVSTGFGVFLLFVTAAVLYPLVVTDRKVLSRTEITTQIKFLEFTLKSDTIATSTLRKGHVVLVRSQYGSLWSVEYQTSSSVISFRSLKDEQACIELIEFLDELRDWAVPKGELS